MSNEQFEQLMEEIKQTRSEMQEKIGKLQKEVSANQDKTAQTIVQKLKADRGYTFRKKGHEQQFRFNLDIDEHIQKAREEAVKIIPSSETGAKSLEKLKAKLHQGSQAIAARQKRIKVADRSDYGWAVVETYDSDELAENSEDEKRLFRAEKAAEKKCSKRKRRFPRKDESVQKLARNQSAEMTPQSVSAVATKQAGSSDGQQTSQASRPIGPCFRCAAWGHLQRNCPKMAKYPFYNECVVNPVCNIVCEEVCKCSQGHGKEFQSLHPGDVIESDQGKTFDIAEIDTLKVECFDAHELDKLSLCDPQLQRCWEISQSTSNGPKGQILNVKGRLKAATGFWVEVLQTPSPVIDWIQEGYKLPLVKVPTQFFQANHKSAVEHSDFVTEAINELLNYHCIREVPNQPHVCSPLSVVCNGKGKRRLVINLRHLNQYLWKTTFKYEDLRTLMQMLSPRDYMFTFDLKSGYHHLDIFPKHWQYLGFKWDSGTGNKYFTFTVLPFGLSTACYAFTKLIRPLIRHWRGMGIRAVIYVDDGIVAVEGEHSARHVSMLIQKDLQNAGFITNLEKSNWVPRKHATWLGFDINLESAQLTIPKCKIEALQSQIQHALTHKLLAARKVASIIGKIIAMLLALGPIARFMTHGL